MSKQKNEQSIIKLKEQYLQAHLSGDVKLKKMLEAILKKLGEKIPKV